ncbi:MAG: polysaccharide deacetylase family protein [Ruminococcus sp.]|nr:polysaccharide deacetylase family protein [Ruminococcus sp.]
MNIKKILCAAALVFIPYILSSCGGDTVPEEKAVPSDGYVAVYREIRSAETSSETTAAVPEIPEPMSLENGYPYLASSLILGDGICGGIYENKLLTIENIISVKGAGTDNILNYRINGVKIRDVVGQSEKPYIYLWFGEEKNYTEYSAEEYGEGILELAEEIRRICPESMVLALGNTPVCRDKPYADKIEEYNESLHYLIRSTPDEYIIYTDIFFTVAEDGYLGEDFCYGEEISPMGCAAVLEYIERDRFYNDIREENMYGDITAERAAYTVSPGKTAYLTFDDGPSKYTPQILDILRENGIKASFFITGWCIEGREDVLKSIAEEGHTVALHSWSHDYDKIYGSEEAWLKDFARVYGRVYGVCGCKPWAFRYPGGSYNNHNKDTADGIIDEMNRRGFTYFDWNAATADASVYATYESCMENIKESLNSDHEVVLMHDSLELTPEYLQDVIDYIREQGYSFETIDAADPVQF